MRLLLNAWKPCSQLCSDIFSFYKEESAGETSNLVHDRAIATGQPPYEVLVTLLQETLAAIETIRSALKGERARATWETFLEGYTAFHYYAPRYEIARLTDFKHANPDLC